MNCGPGMMQETRNRILIVQGRVPKRCARPAQTPAMTLSWRDLTSIGISSRVVRAAGEPLPTPLGARPHIGAAVARGAVRGQAGPVRSSGRHALRQTGRRGRRVEALCRHLSRVGLDGVLADLDRAGVPAHPPGEAAGDGFTWDEPDREDRAWWPQGVASTRSGRVLRVAWSARRARGRTPGSRVSVVDRSDPDHPRYRHVLLVTARGWPRRSLGRSLGPVPVHAGGIALLGDLLYVADTIAGVRVFRLTDVLRVPRPDAAPGPGLRAVARALGRRLTGGDAAHGYDHVLPQALALRVPLLAGTARLRYSFLSVGRVEGQLSLVVGEYRRAGAGSPRLVRYALDEATGLPLVGRAGRCAPLEVHDGQPPRMQGVAVHGSTWYVSASAGADRAGDLHVGAPGAFRRHRGVLPPGPEDLDWSHPGQELWCATEHPGRRWVFPVDAARWPGPGG